MDSEGDRLAGLSDEEWAKRVKKIERDIERERRGSSPVRKHWPLAAVAVALALVTGFLVVRSGHGKSSGDTSPSSPAIAAGPYGGSPAATWHRAAVALVMPRAAQVGPYSAAEVHAALSRARKYLLTARSSSAVLADHHVAALKAAIDPRALSAAKREPVQQTLVATFLAPKNTLAAPVRLKGNVTDRYAPTSGHVAGHLVVSVNLVWAYALKAGYSVAPIPSHVVAIHEHLDLGFYLSADMSGPNAKPSPISDDTLWFDIDCGYFKQQLLGLPRIDDPDALPVTNGDADQDTAFDPNSDVNVSTHACRT